MTWPIRFLEAIPVGVNVESVRHKLAIKRLDHLLEIQTKALNAKHPHGVYEATVQTISAINQVRRCHEAEIGANFCNVETKEAAWSAAWQQEAKNLLELLGNVS